MTGGPDPLTAGWQALRSGRAADAERLGRQITQQDSRTAEGWRLLGVACHAQGRLAEALACCERLLQLRPVDAEAEVNKGNALRGLRRPAEAAECYRRALALHSDLPEAHNNLGNALRDLGQPAEAAAHYRRALELRADYPEALNNLGSILRGQGRLAEAAESYRQALALRPDLAEVLYNLGNVLRDQGQFAEAVDCYGRALTLRPDLPGAHFQLGNAQRALGRHLEAVNNYRRARELQPQQPEVLINLGNTLCDLGQFAEAEVCLREALRLWPDLPEAAVNLGYILCALGRPAQAEDCLRQVLAVRPELPEAHNNLGLALRSLDQPDEAERCLRQALALRPGYVEALNNLGATLRDVGRLGEAELCLRQAVAAQPNYAAAHSNLGVALQCQGRPVEAEACFRQALALRPGYAQAHDGLLLTLYYRPGLTLEELAAAHADYQARHAAPLRATWRPHANDRDPERPLRVGLVSPDFCRHPVGYFLIRAAEALARRPGAVVYYSDRVLPDDMTARFRACAALWRDTAGRSDAEMAEQVRADGIDVLIDLAGHTAGNRLLVFARKPAPVQCSWLGYEGATGLDAIDYLVADERLVPPGAETHYAGRVLRLPGGYATYDPPPDAPEPGPPPALSAERVTFGCFNNPAKLSEPALAAFAAAVRAAPGSRLVLKYPGLDDPSVGSRVRVALAAGGVGPDRVELLPGSLRAEYFAAYREVDVALDPFPFNGGVTTCDALWMGVPVVTLPGETFASRHGLSHLASVGLTELAAHDAEEYVALASGLARELERLAELRSGLRQRVAQSPLCDAERLVEELLAALRKVWRESMTPSKP